MKDFEEIYDKIYSEFMEKVDSLNNNQKKIKKYVFLKLIKLIIIIAIIFLFLILITKNAELLVLLIFVPGPLMIYYFILKGRKMRNTKLDMDIDTMQDKIYNTIVSECFNRLQYNSKQGINSEIYDKGKFEKYDEYYSNDKIEGILNSGNNIKMSYVATSRGRRQFDSFRWIFSGYFLEVELNKSTKIQMKITDNKIEYFDGQVSKAESDTIINTIRNILTQFKKVNKVTPEITIYDDKLYIRVLINDFEDNNYNKILNKDSLKKYYKWITGILELTDKIIKIL